MKSQLLYLRTHTKILSVVASVSNPSAGEAETGGSLGPTYLAVWLTGELQTSEGPCLKMGGIREGGTEFRFCSLHTLLQVYTHEYACLHA